MAPTRRSIAPRSAASPLVGGLFLLGALSASPAAAQTTLALPGTAVDLTATAAGDLLVVTSQGDVWEVDPSGTHTVLAAPGQFQRSLVAVVSLGTGSAAVIDDTGSIYEVGTVPGVPQLVYSDVYLIREPTDLVLDTGGNYWVFCKTVSNNTRCVAHVSADGQRWAYYAVTRAPLAAAPDPVTGGLLMTDLQFGLESLTSDADGAPVLTAVGPAGGYTVGNLDGDVAVTASGDAYFAAGNSLRFHDRSSGTTSLYQTFGSTVRGVALAPASAGLGDSLWVVEGAPSTLREVLVPETAGPLLGPVLAEVPGTGAQLVTYGLNVNCAITDLDGNLLVGGDNFGSAVRIDRIALPSLAVTTVATGADGLSSRIEGMHQDRDGRIWALARYGAIHFVDEGPGPPTVGAIFTDPLDQIITGKDLVKDRRGDFYVADYQNWSFGVVSRLDASGAFTTLLALQDTRGLLPEVFGARLLANEWNGTGFQGVVGVVDEATASLIDLPGFDGLNISNQQNVGDGDMVMDATGRIYVSCEDEFAVVVWNPETQRKRRIGSGYLNRATGLTISRSTNPAASSTGWSLYVSQWNRLHEIPGVAPPAPRALDLEAPGAGRLYGYTRPEWGRPVAIASDPAFGRLVAVTDGGRVVAIPGDGGPGTVLADGSSGLSGDLVAVTADPNGDLLVGTRDGVVYRLVPSSGYAAVVEFADPFDQIAELGDLVHDPGVGTYLLDRAPSADGVARLHRLVGGVLVELALPYNGAALAIDPAAGDLFVAQGANTTSEGELLRVHLGASPALANHWPSNAYRPFELDGEGTGLALDGEGGVFVASDRTGRVEFVDRATQAVTLVAGNYELPRDLVVAAGRPGVAGPQGASLFVLDGHAVYEHGVPGSVPTSPIVRSLDPDPFMVPALFQFGGGHELQLESPGDAGLPYLVLAGRSGQQNGYPLVLVGGDASDTRSIAQDFDTWWIDAATGIAPFQRFFGVLDGSGRPPAPITFDAPATPAIVGLDLRIDLTWVTLDVMAPNLIRTVGGTAQTYVGL